MDGRAGHGAVGAEHAAMPGRGPQQRVATLALVVVLAGVRRHDLALRVAAAGTGNGGLQDHVSSDSQVLGL